MRILLVTMLILIGTKCAEAQCEPDDQWVEMALSSIYPKPAVDDPEIAALGFEGIDSEAKIGEPYRFTWSVLARETTGTDALNAFDVPLVSIEVLFDSTVVEFHGESFDVDNPVSISNTLPSGLTFDFEQSIWTPEDGAENDGLAGCFSIAGNPDETVEPGIYALRLRTRITIVNAGQNLTSDILIPDRGEFQFVNFPGEYILEINPAPVGGGGGVNNVCEFQGDLPLEDALIFPLPFSADPDNPFDLGINKEAVIGQEFDFTWTVIWPDTFIAPVVFVEAYAGTQTFFLDETVVVFEGDTVDIPDGLTLEMFPEDGVLLPNSEEPAACIKLSGIPSADVIPGSYFFAFFLETCLTIPGVFEGCQDAFIPSQLSGFPGIYELVVKPEGTTAVKETLNDKVSIRVNPNPFSSQTMIEFNSSDLSGDYRFEAFDVSGKKITSHQINMKSVVQRIIFDGGDLEDGIYFYQLRGEEGIVTGKLVVQR